MLKRLDWAAVTIRCRRRMHDFTIIGGGIVGASAAWQLQRRHPDASVLLIEKETDVGLHQTGRNSGVIHAGIYYEPGSLKARFCKLGVNAVIDFCQTHDISFEQCGKLIVATDESEHERLLALHERARVNELDVERLDEKQLMEAEPNISGCSAIFLKTTGIVDYARITRKMSSELQRLGGRLALGSSVMSIDEKPGFVALQLDDGRRIQSKQLIVCGGLMSDRLLRMQGLPVDYRVIPYRGEYYKLPAAKNNLVRHLIYPVPDPALPFLGIHLTRTIDGGITVGPSALQGWKREGYGKINFNFRDTYEQLTYPGFWRVSRRYLRTGIAELRNAMFKRSYLKQVHKYCPTILLSDLGPYPVGVRAMAVRNDGQIIHDFLFAETQRTLHVCNAPSPAATSAIPIGEHICDKLDRKLADA